MIISTRSGRISFAVMVGIFAVISLFLVIVGSWYFNQTTKSIQNQKTDELRAIAALKIQQIVAWRTERLTEARINSSGIIGSQILHWLADPADTELLGLLMSHWQILMAASGYQNIVLVSPNGELLLSAVGELASATFEIETGKLVQRAIASQTAIFGDFAHCNLHDYIHLDVAAPVFDKTGQLRAAILFSIKPETFLFPLIQSWPTPSQSAETLLVRRDGDDALFLNELRHRPSPPLTIRIPIARTDVPAVAAINGKTGVFVGNDYRGVPVVSELSQVPGSLWFMVTKIDCDEIFAAARAHGRLILIFIFLSIVVSGAVVTFWFSQQQRELYEDNKHFLEKCVAERTAELEAVNKELEAFSYSVSHDLKAPLRSIDGFARFLEDDYSASFDDEGRRLLKVIRNSAKEMGQLITDLLAFSRMSRKGLEVNRLNMEELVREVWNQAAGLRDGREICLRVGALPAARGDLATIREVIFNLLANSIKFTRLCDKPEVEVTGYQKDGESIFAVKDNGAGFNMAYKDKLFCVFQRLHSSDEFEGTGIGLAIVHRVIHRHGGKVWAEGKENEGATFYFTLPTDNQEEK